MLAPSPAGGRPRSRTKFRSRLEGHQAAKPGKLEFNGETVRFPSRIELVRAAELMLLQRAGHITHLRFHPNYAHKVNGVKIWTYRADSEYRRDGVVVVEDVKPRGAPIDRLSRAKMKLHMALFSRYMTLEIYNG